MHREKSARIAIVDYGLGNVFNVQRACAFVGMDAYVTSNNEDIIKSDAIILPGVGAFGDAMNMLQRLNLISTLHDFAQSGKPMMGICLGMQLLMEKSYEFGEHQGLGIIPGEVITFEKPLDSSGKYLKVPQVGWNHICSINNLLYHNSWTKTMLEGIEDGEYMYFVHSFYVIPNDNAENLSITRYGNIEFCSALTHANIFACQFHPEKSGIEGLKIYHNFRKIISGKFN